MTVRLSIWDQLARIVVLLVFVAGTLAIAVWYRPLIQHNQNLRHEILKLDAQIAKEEEIGRQLKNSIEALRRDPKAVERLARERLGYAKPDETVVRFEVVPTNNSGGARF